MDLVAIFAVFALFVFTLTLLCFCVLPFFSVNKDLYITVYCRRHRLTSLLYYAGRSGVTRVLGARGQNH